MNFIQCSRHHPCQCCQSQHWCSYSEDGAIAHCRKVSDGGTECKDANGNYYYRHVLAEPRAAAPRQTEKVRHEAPRAAPADLHRVYAALLRHLALSDRHRGNLERRGLGAVAVRSNGYRTLGEKGRHEVVSALLHDGVPSELLLSVPGFVKRRGGRGEYVTVSGFPGMLVPCRDLAGRIVALKLRMDDAGQSDQRYRYISSKSAGGPGPGAQVHVPLGTPAQCEVVRLTEGELKADVAFALSGMPTVSVPGTGNWRPALAVLRQLRCRAVRLSFDADAAQVPEVAQALCECAQECLGSGMSVEVERWPARYKGVDDAMAAGAALDVVREDAAWQVLRMVVFSARVAKKRKTTARELEDL
jgi:hypothetical protein